MEKFSCEPFGVVTLVRRKGAKNLTIRIKADELMVSADLYMSREDIVKFIRLNRDTILEKQQEEKASRKLITENFKIENRYFSICVKKDARMTKDLLSLHNSSKDLPYKFTIRCREDIDFDNSDTQKRLAKTVNDAICMAAEKPLTYRTLLLSGRLNKKIRFINIKIENSRWGSCTCNRDINLSAYLILLPQHIIDFVITHELCHLDVMNHGPRFHTLLNKYTGGKEAELKKELDEYSTNFLNYTTEADV